MNTTSIIDAFLQANIQTNGTKYHFNILEELQGNIVENSHTNILIRLLSYRNRFGYIFLQSFCERFFEKFTGNLNGGNIIFETESPLCGTANGRIDGLIYSKYDFAIIIENKINGAGVMPAQLKRYIEDVSKNPKIFSQQPKNNYKKIWVVYLTREGNDKPDNESRDFLINEFDCTIGVYDEITGDRYVALSYSDDILPWLKDEIIPMVQIADIDLYSGLIQYADYLDRLFGDDYDKKISDQIDNFLMDRIGWEKDVYEKHNILTELYTEVNDRIKNAGKKDDYDKYKQYNALAKSIKRINRGLIENFIKASCDYFEGNYQDGHKLFNRCYVKSESKMDFNFVFFTDENWPESIHFEWLSLSTKLWDKETKKYDLYFHVEDKELVGLFENMKSLSSWDSKGPYRNKISYKKEITLSKPILYMTYDELKTELIRVYSEANIENVVNEINKVLKENS